jgi:hypothetical protein
MFSTLNFKQDIFNILLLRLFDNGSDTQGQLFYKDINNSIRYVFSHEPPAGKRILSGQHELRLCRIGDAYEKSCKHKDGFIRATSYKFGIVTMVGKLTPIFDINPGKWEKCIVVGDKISNNSCDYLKIEEIPRAYAFFLSSIYRAFEESRIVRLTVMNCDNGIKRQFESCKGYGQGTKLFSIF